MSLASDIKLILRVSSTELDIEINDLISAAQADLALSGIYVTSTSDAMIKRAIGIYCKANFGYNNGESERLSKSYDSLKQQLMMTRDYSDYKITFDINDSLGAAIKKAKITLTLEDGSVYDVYTNQSGLAYFYTRELQNVDYSVSKDGYTASTGTTDLSSTKTITVVMTGA